MLIRTETEAYELVPVGGVIIDADGEVMRLQDLTGLGEVGFIDMEGMHSDPVLPAHLIYPRRYGDEERNRAIRAAEDHFEKWYDPDGMPTIEDVVNAALDDLEDQ